MSFKIRSKLILQHGASQVNPCMVQDGLFNHSNNKIILSLSHYTTCRRRTCVYTFIKTWYIDYIETVILVEIYLWCCLKLHVSWTVLNKLWLPKLRQIYLIQFEIFQAFRSFLYWEKTGKYPGVDLWCRDHKHACSHIL